VTLLAAKAGAASIWCSGRSPGNVGDHVGDDPEAVAHNRATLANEAHLPPPEEWVWVRQVHGAGVHVADAPTGAIPPEADAAVTHTRGLPLAIVTADCAPVVLASETGLAVVHAGHRGLAAGVIEATASHLDGEVHAFLGPCIRPAQYEFGRADLDALVANFGPEVEAQTARGTAALNIPAAVRVALARAGIEDFEDCGICTADSPAYFSHRRDGATGRQVTVAVLR
jgi:YfiH family protein